MGYHHNIDRFDHDVVAGWIYLKESPATRVLLELEIDGRAELSFEASEMRPDLVAAGIGDQGRCAFQIDLRTIVGSRRSSVLNLKLADSGFSIATAGGHLLRQTTSRFGGLWIDRHDFAREAMRRLESGVLSEQFFFHFMEFAVKGYTVFPNVIPEGLVNDLNAEIDSIWEETPGRALIETYQVGGTLKYIPVQKDLKGGPNKLLDVYSFSPAARDVILHPTLVGFLEGLFDDSINVIQSLSFMVGSEQPIHKDTAYVRVQPEMHLAASWIALEDIRPGTGELEYYVGSHRDEDFLFGGREKWSQSHPNEVEKYLESLHVDARNHGHRRERFLARKGDVLIWHADLAHGGSKIIDAKRTRKSLVAHYSPRSATPFCNSPSKITYGNHAFLSSINP